MLLQLDSGKSFNPICMDHLGNHSHDEINEKALGENYIQASSMHPANWPSKLAQQIF
jgi:hypothetical protein